MFNKMILPPLPRINVHQALINKFTHTFNKSAVALVCVFLPTLASATPSIMLEKSQAYIFGNKLQAFQVPTEALDGTIQYYDVTVTLTPNDDGSVSPSATVESSESKVVKTRALVPGKYKSSDGGTTCTITNITLTNGRIQSFVNCLYGNSKSELSFASGNVDADHPNYAELSAVGIHKRADVKTQTWGIITNGSFAVGSCGYYYTKYPLGIKTDGKTLVFSVYSKSTPSAFQCSGIFNKL